jgi:hypothetical protein
LPRQIYDAKTFKKLVEKADEIRVVRGEKVKLKLRTKRMLYTYVADRSEADKLLKNVNKPIKEVEVQTTASTAK